MIGNGLDGWAGLLQGMASVMEPVVIEVMQVIHTQIYIHRSL